MTFVDHGAPKRLSGVTSLTSIEIASWDFCGFGPSWGEVGIYPDNPAVPTVPDVNAPFATATSLAMAAGRTFSRAALVRAVLAELDRGYAALRHGGAVAILEAWKRLSPSQYGKPVVIAGGSVGEIRGLTRGIDEEGALLVERDDGGLERVGAVQFVVSGADSEPFGRDPG